MSERRDLEVIADLVPAGSRVLDLGCGTGELLAHLLDATIQALGADRGCILVREEGRFRATSARNFRSEALAETEEEISSTIAQTAVEE